MNNPYIKVTWEDTPENFTPERIKRVKSYLQTKYNTKHKLFNFIQLELKNVSFFPQDQTYKGDQVDREPLDQCYEWKSTCPPYSSGKIKNP